MDVVVKLYRPSWDRAGIVLSALCLLHCVAPVAAAVLPSLALVVADRDWVHSVFAVALALIAPAAFVPGYRRHRNRRIIFPATAGLALVMLAASAVVGDGAEALVTVLGSGLLVLAHGLNHRFCRRCQACQTPAGTGCP